MNILPRVLKIRGFSFILIFGWLWGCWLFQDINPIDLSDDFMVEFDSIILRRADL